MWSSIPVAGPFPLLWNSFPFHPHWPEKEASNRKPKHEEVEEGKEYLNLLVSVFKPKELYAVGRVAEGSLKQSFPDLAVTYLRHPSFGGKPTFEAGMKSIYKKYSN